MKLIGTSIKNLSDYYIKYCIHLSTDKKKNTAARLNAISLQQMLRWMLSRRLRFSMLLPARLENELPSSFIATTCFVKFQGICPRELCICGTYWFYYAANLWRFCRTLALARVPAICILSVICPHTNQFLRADCYSLPKIKIKNSRLLLENQVNVKTFAVNEIETFRIFLSVSITVVHLKYKITEDICRMCFKQYSNMYRI